MSTQEIHEDLSFVRAVVTQRERRPMRSRGVLWMWAAQVLVGYVLVDLAPNYAGLYFLVTGLLCGVVSGIIGHRMAIRSGQIDRENGRRQALHWFGGLMLILGAAFGLQAVMPALSGQACGQIVVVMVGLTYYFAGVHFDRMFLWISPVLIIGGITVSLLPAQGWTVLGLVIAVSLVVPTLLPGVTMAPAVQEGAA